MHLRKPRGQARVQVKIFTSRALTHGLPQPRFVIIGGVFKKLMENIDYEKKNPKAVSKHQNKL